MNLNRVLLIFLMLVVAILGCNVNNEPLGVRRELVGEGDVGKILQTTLFSTPDDTSIVATFNAGTSSLLSAGEAQNVISEFLMAFPRTGSGEIKAAKLILPIHLVAGEGSAYNPTVHRVTGAWKEDSV